MKAEQRATKFISLNVKKVFCPTLFCPKQLIVAFCFLNLSYSRPLFSFFCLFNTVIGIIKLIGSK